uniref:Sorting nexin 10a n=1 Tax=Gasterosteus aculeatus aculeatus TaxID=481459 RepID=A0AAQ4Q9L5_GASAC
MLSFDVIVCFENLQETISVCVRNPRLCKDDLWHSHVDYEICLQTNSMCFRKKTSCVRRRYSEFVWLRHCLEQNALVMELPKLPPRNPFFSLKNTEQVVQRMKGFQEFLESVLHTTFLLSDSRLHLFLQSDLSITRMSRCALGKTKYTVAEAIQRSSSGFTSRSEKSTCDSDCERYRLWRKYHTIVPQLLMLNLLLKSAAIPPIAALLRRVWDIVWTLRREEAPSPS